MSSVGPRLHGSGAVNGPGSPVAGSKHLAGGLGPSTAQGRGADGTPCGGGLLAAGGHGGTAAPCFTQGFVCVRALEHVLFSQPGTRCSYKCCASPTTATMHGFGACGRLRGIRLEMGDRVILDSFPRPSDWGQLLLRHAPRAPRAPASSIPLASMQRCRPPPPSPGPRQRHHEGHLLGHPPPCARACSMYYALLPGGP